MAKVSAEKIRRLRKLSKKQEARTAKEAGGKVQIASGAIRGMKGDVRTGIRTVGFNEDDYLIENKLTTTDVYTLNLATWLKIEKEALRDNMRTPLMQIDIKEESYIVGDYRLLHSKFLNYDIFCADVEFKSSVKLRGDKLKELEEDVADRGSILVAKLTSGNKELGLINKKYWRWD